MYYIRLGSLAKESYRQSNNELSSLPYKSIVQSKRTIYIGIAFLWILCVRCDSALRIMKRFEKNAANCAASNMPVRILMCKA